MNRTAQSTQADTATAIGEVKAGLEGEIPKLVVIYFSPKHDAAQVAELAKLAWPDSQTIGCSTSGEIVTGCMSDGSIVAMAIEADTFANVKIAIVDDMGDLSRVNAACELLGDSVQADPSTHVGLVLMDGLSMKEEAVMNRLGDLTDLRFIGGSAGDDLAFKKTYVIANGQAYSNAAILAVLEMSDGCEFKIVKTQSFCRTGKTLTPTKVDEATREVLEFDGKPAREAYMDAVGASTPEEAANRFMSNPVGLMVGEDPYVRSPMTFDEEALKFYCAVKPGVDLELLKSTDIIEDTRKALEEAGADEAYEIVAVFNFNCILRTLELKSRGLTEAYGSLFSMPTIGFSTYGEADVGHINQTATMVVILRKKKE